MLQKFTPKAIMLPFFTRIYNCQFSKKNPGIISTAAERRLIANIYCMLTIWIWTQTNTNNFLSNKFICSSDINDTALLPTWGRKIKIHFLLRQLINGEMEIVQLNIQYNMQIFQNEFFFTESINHTEITKWGCGQSNFKPITKEADANEREPKDAT